MSAHDIVTALQRMEAVLERRPQFGDHEDAAATAVWEGGTRVVASHVNGTSMVTDMPTELGGSGQQVSPGWMFRAGIAACATTSVVFAAAVAGITLTTLSVVVGSRSDTRGLLGMRDAHGTPVFAGPRDMRLHVRVSAVDATPETLREVVAAGLRRSPIPLAVQHAVPVDLVVDVES